MMEKRQRRPGVCSVLPVRTPACDRGLCAPTKGIVRLMQRAPGLAFAPNLQIEQFSQIMAQSRDERGVLPARAVAGTAEAVNTPVWPPLHRHVALELFQGFERNLDRMPVESAGLGVVVRGAGWQIAHCYGKPFEQPFSQRPHPQV